MSKSSEIIPTLHYLSKDLREFKHLFENYKNLISKIMSVGRRDSPQSIHLDADHKVFLTNSALSRFDRLRDRLQYLMLNTIEGYLEEIAALSTTVRSDGQLFLRIYEFSLICLGSIST